MNLEVTRNPTFTVSAAYSKMNNRIFDPFVLFLMTVNATFASRNDDIRSTPVVVVVVVVL